MSVSYMTRQQKAVLSCIESVHGGASAAELAELLHARGDSVGLTTVYRQLERLVEEGRVNKYIVDGSNAAYFEYVDHDHCGEETCFHCKCEKCGQLIHLHCHELEAIQKHIFAHHGFQLDSLKTVFYGVCEACS